MDKKNDRFAGIEGLSEADLASVTGGRGGAANALDIKRRQDRDRDRDRDRRDRRDRDRDDR